MNSSLSLHRVALDLLIGARLSLASNPNTFLEDSFPVVVDHHRVLDLRSRYCERTRSEDRSDKKEWALPPRSTHMRPSCLVQPCSATAPLPVDRQLHGSRLTPSHDFRESVRSLPRYP